MTDKEIIKAFEWCIGGTSDKCRNCPLENERPEAFCVDKLEELVLELLNRQQGKVDYQKAEINLLKDEKAEMSVEIIRQQAEIERSNRSIVIIEQTVEDQSRTIKSQTDLINKLYCNIETARVEAIKEFGNFLTRNLINEPFNKEYVISLVRYYIKEMVGEE